MSTPDVKLNEMDSNEWFDVCRSFKPGLTREEFEVMWEEFQELKRRHALQ